MKESGMYKYRSTTKREKREIENSVLVGFGTIHWLSYCSKKMGRKNGNNGSSFCKRRKSWDKFLHFIDNDCIDNNGKNKLVIFSKDIDNIQNLIESKRRRILWQQQ